MSQIRRIRGRYFLIYLCAAAQNIDLASFLRWYVTVELYDPAFAKRFYSIYELLEDTMKKVTYHPYFTSFLSLKKSRAHFLISIELSIMCLVTDKV